MVSDTREYVRHALIDAEKLRRTASEKRDDPREQYHSGEASAYEKILRYVEAIAGGR